MARNRTAATQAGKQSFGVRRRERDDQTPIESYSSPKVHRTDDNASFVFAAFLFAACVLVVLAAGWLVVGTVNVWTLTLAIGLAVLALFTVHIAPQWERVVILRFGRYHKTAGPGLYVTIPFIDYASLHADQRMMLTGFSAEETLTADLVPVNVDAAVFWTVWDAKKACLEVEDYYDSVALAAQTTLRDAIGRKEITELATQRDQLDAELREAIEEKTASWGVSILFVEIRDIVIPKDLQRAMSAEARAGREKGARISLAEVERDIAAMLHDAADIYREDEIALKLRQMHLVNESLKESQGSVVVPSAYTEGFVDGEKRPVI